MRKLSPLLGCLQLLFLCVLTSGISGVLIADDFSYNRDVRPLLSTHCFACHGPDDQTRESGVRLDVAGEVHFDEVIARIQSEDPDIVMPPPAFNKPLNKDSIATLKQWIENGATYEEHWAFVVPVKPPVPRGTHPVDHFIDARLEAAGRHRSAAADPMTLIRRLYLDLIGLPPPVEVADRFAANPSADAYAKIVDRLLRSPRYGERWARRWLDLARYADTNGYEKDRDRNIWPYRDWVIRAINDDMPLDQFSIEQLAGDMLPNPTDSQLVATGFHRNTMLNEEGGIDPLEFRFHALTDRVATTGTTWLGLTVGCAQCHTHKYDPITHQDYYGMMAYFNNADEPKFYVPVGDTEKDREETEDEVQRIINGLASHWPTAEAVKKTAAAAQAAEDAQAKEENRAPKKLPPPHPPRDLSTALADWIDAERANVAPWQTIVPERADANTPFLSIESGGIVLAAGDTSKHDIYKLKFSATKTPVYAVRIEVLPDDRLPGRGPGLTYYEGPEGDFFLSELEIENADGKRFEISDASQTAAGNQFGDSPATAAQACDGDIQTGWSIGERSTGKRNVAVFRLKDPIPEGDAFTMRMHFGRHYASSLGKFRWSVTSSDAQITASILTPELTVRLQRPNAAEDRHLRNAFLLNAPELSQRSQLINRLRTSNRGIETLIMRERPSTHKRQTFVHQRGEYTRPTDVVLPHVPDAIAAASAMRPTNRLEFARWLVSQQNPLTARVVVNRQWAAFFGTGIVSTLEDFGMQGALPSHPDLLDFLAVDLMENGWSLKYLHRLIVTSATYQQSSSLPPDDLLSEADRLLGRFPRSRLEAEIIRDASLSAAGLLSDKMFGDPVRPPQPDSGRSVNYSRSTWNASTGTDRYRRSIYTYQKRTAPFAMFTTFDAGSGEACLARRDVSNTPLQALTLMNDPMFIEIAEAYGQRIEKFEGDDAQKINAGFRWLMTRGADELEMNLLRQFHAKHHDWTALARVLLCLDESITKN